MGLEGKILLVALLLGMLIPISQAHAEHVFDRDAYAQYLDIAQLEAEKSVFEFEGTSYVIYYGYHGSLDAMGEERAEPTGVEMSINQDKKSIEVSFDEVPEKNNFWVRIPFEVLTADKEQYQVLIDGEDALYDLMKMPEGYVIGMIIEEDTKNVEIIGTKVIPEFGSLALFVLGAAILGIIYVVRKSPFGVGWTRIN